MAMGDRIECPVGGVVETTLQLDFRKKQVELLEDAPNFKRALFDMIERTKGKVAVARPQEVAVTEDDQKITVRWSFHNDLKQTGTPVFVEGDDWELLMSYQPANDADATNAPERRFQLGFVKLVKP